MLNAAFASFVRAAANEPPEFGELLASIAPIVAGVVLAPVASIAASALFAPLEFSALIVLVVASGSFAFRVSLAAAALFICAPCFVAICSQAKARFSPGAVQLNLALIAMGASPVKFTSFELKQF